MNRKLKEPIQYESLVNKIVEKSVKGKTTVEELDFKDIIKIQKYSKTKDDLVKNIRELFPDIELAMEIVTSLIRSPNIMEESSLNFKLENIDLPTNTQSGIVGFVNEYVLKTYNMADKLDSIIEEALFTKGAYVELNIPPNNILDILKQTKTKPSVATESILLNNGNLLHNNYKDEDGVFNIISNPSILLNDEIEEKRIGFEIEQSLRPMSAGVESLIINDSGYGIMNDDVLSNNKPIVKKLNHNKVIPITNKDDVSKHYGYFIILDDNIKGNNNNSINPLKQNDNTDNDLIKKVKNTLIGHTANAPELSGIDSLRESIIKLKLQKYINGTSYKNLKNLNFEMDDDLVMSIAENIIKKKNIKILFVPSDLVSYYAFHYRSNGTGESLLERLTVLMSMRAIMIFTKMLSYIKSSVTTTDVKVDLDPDDANYKKSMEAIMAEVIKNRQISLPIGMLKVDDLTDWVHKLGFSFNFKHPGLPDVNIDIEEKSNEITPIDDSLKEDLDKYIITSLYLTPEMVDSGYSTEFATTILANNKLLRNRIMKLQTLCSRDLTSDIRKKLRLDGRFKDKLKEYIEPNIKKIKSYLIKNDNNLDKESLKKAKDEDVVDYLIEKIIVSIVITLPKPETTEDTNVSDLMSNYSDLLDDTVDKLFSSDLIPSDYIGELGDNLDDLKNLVKHTLLRRYIQENNILPDFTKMFTLDEDGKPVYNLLDDFNGFVNSIEAVTIPFLKNNKKLIAKLDKKKEKIDNSGEESEEDDYSNDNGTGDTPTDDGDSTENDTGSTDETTDDTGSEGGDEPTDDTGSEGGDEPTDTPEENGDAPTDEETGDGDIPSDF